METETGDWKPEVGDTAWMEWHNISGITQIREVFIAKINRYFGKNEFHVRASAAHVQNGSDLIIVNPNTLYPTPEAALVSIKVYDLEGKEVVATRDSPDPAFVDVVSILWKLRNQEVSPTTFWIVIETMFDQGMFLDVLMKLQEIRENEGTKWVQDPWWMGRRDNLQTYASGIKEALQALHGIAFNMEIAPNPEGSARLEAAAERFASLPPIRTLTDDEKKEALKLALDYAGAIGCQIDGMDRAGFLVYRCREELLAFIENREPDIDDEY